MTSSHPIPCPALCWLLWAPGLPPPQGPGPGGPGSPRGTGAWALCSPLLPHLAHILATARMMTVPEQLVLGGPYPEALALTGPSSPCPFRVPMAPGITWASAAPDPSHGCPPHLPRQVAPRGWPSPWGPGRQAKPRVSVCESSSVHTHSHMRTCMEGDSQMSHGALCAWQGPQGSLLSAFPQRRRGSKPLGSFSGLEPGPGQREAPTQPRPQALCFQAGVPAS